VYFVHVDVIRVNNASVPTYEDKHFSEWCGSREGIFMRKMKIMCIFAGKYKE
jgi:hypothetical protein